MIVAAGCGGRCRHVGKWLACKIYVGGHMHVARYGWNNVGQDKAWHGIAGKVGMTWFGMA